MSFFILYPKYEFILGRAFKIEISKVSGSVLAAEICMARTIVCCGASIVAHFACKVSYSASPQTFVECSRNASCRCAATAMLFPPKTAQRFFWI